VPFLKLLLLSTAPPIEVIIVPIFCLSNFKFAVPFSLKSERVVNPRSSFTFGVKFN